MSGAGGELRDSEKAPPQEGKCQELAVLSPVICPSPKGRQQFGRGQSGAAGSETPPAPR